MNKACCEPAKCSAIIDGMVADIDPLEAALSASQDANRGSEQERKAQDDDARRNQHSCCGLLFEYFANSSLL